jgi:hypothetical protein
MRHHSFIELLITYQKLVSQEYIEKQKRTMSKYLETHPLSTTREIGRNCHQSHSIVIQVIDDLLKKDRISELRFPKLRTRPKKKNRRIDYQKTREKKKRTTDKKKTRSYYITPNSTNLDKIFLQIIASKKLELNRFKKIKFLKQKEWTFSTLIRNAISTFHEEYKVFRLEKIREINSGKSRPSEHNMMTEFHKKFTQSFEIGSNDPELSNMSNMEVYQFLISERYGFAKYFRLKTLKLRKTGLDRLLEILRITKDYGDYRFAADKLGIGNKQAKRLLAKISNGNDNIDFFKVIRYQEYEKNWIDTQFDERMLTSLLYGGASKEQIRDYLYTYIPGLYMLSDRDTKTLERLIIQMTKRAAKIQKMKQKINLK